MTSLKIHIDLADEGCADLVARAADQLAWEVVHEPQCSKPPDILVTGPERLSLHSYLRERLDLQPQVILAGLPEETDPLQILGVRVRDFLSPSDGMAAAVRVLEEAGDEHLRLRRDQSMWHQLEERYAEASVLLDLALELGPELSTEEVLEKIVQHIADDLGYAIVSIMLLDEDDGHLAIKAAKGLSGRIVDSSRMEVGKGVSGTVAMTGEPLLVRDIETDERFAKVQSHGRYTTKSLICVPLKVGDRVIGVLNANNKHRSGPLNEYDLHILSVFAAHVSVSIERVRLYHNLERKAEELEAAYGQLKVVDQVKSDFIVNVSHEYRTPVTIILGYLELLRGTLTEPGQIEKVNVAMEAASRLSSLIDDSTSLLRLDTGSTPYLFQEIGLHFSLEEAVRGQWSRFGLKGVELSLDVPENLPPLWADQDKMIKVFNKLLDNALKFTPSGGYTRVRAAGGADGGVVVTVEDNGQGVPSEDRARIFERFEQGGDIMTEKPDGTGLGLPIAKAIVQGHGGTITLDEKYREGCRIVVSLPSLESRERTASANPEPGNRNLELERSE